MGDEDNSRAIQDYSADVGLVLHICPPLHFLKHPEQAHGEAACPATATLAKTLGD